MEVADNMPQPYSGAPGAKFPHISGRAVPVPTMQDMGNPPPPQRLYNSGEFRLPQGRGDYFGGMRELPRLVPVELDAPSGSERGSVQGMGVDRYSRTRLTPQGNAQRLALSLMPRGSEGMEINQDGSPTDPMPYQTQEFKSSTVMRKVWIARRHHDMFGGKDYHIAKKKGVAFHTERYGYEDVREKPTNDVLSQRERLQAETDYLEKLRGRKRKHERLAKQGGPELQMGGQRVNFVERFDVHTELMKLKSMALPAHARDLYIGRGFNFPKKHATITPRPPPSTKVTASAPAGIKRQRSTLPPVPLKRQSSNFTNMNRGQKRSNMPASHSLPSYAEREHSNVTSNSKPSVSSLPRVETDVVPPTTPIIMDREEDIRPHTRAESEMEIDLPMEEPAAPDEENGASRAELIPSPRKSALSRRAVATPNPLKHVNLGDLVADEQLTMLKKTFKRLDTDADGHLMYAQLKSQLPSELSSQQERFIKQVYDITSASTFFGITEFVSLSCLCEKIANLSDVAKEGYSTLNFATLQDLVIQYTEAYQEVDKTQKGKISLDDLLNILSPSVQDEINTDLMTQVQQVMAPEAEVPLDAISKLDYLAHLPYFLSLRHA